MSRISSTDDAVAGTGCQGHGRPPADIDSLKVFVLSTTHAANGVASIVALAMLVFAPIASYDLQARAAGALGVIGLGAAILGTD